jgi:WD40 repeat protein
MGMIVEHCFTNLLSEQVELECGRGVEMERKLASLMLLFLLVVSALVLAYNVQPVKATGTICVKTDGSIEPPTAPTQAPSVTVAAGSGSYVYFYDEAGNELWSFDTGSWVVSVAVSSDGEYIAVGSHEHELFLFARIPSLSLLWEKTVPIAWGFAGIGFESKSVAISAHGEYVVAGCNDSLYVFKKDGALLWSHEGRETCVGISPDGNYIVSCELEGEVHLFSIASSTPLWTHYIYAFWVATSNPGYVIASGYEVYLFDNTGLQMWNYFPDRSGYIRVDMSSDGLGAVAAVDDPGDIACYLWYFNLSGLVWKFTPSPPEQDFYSVAISADGNIVSTGPGTIAGIYVFSRDGTSLQTMPQSSTVHSVDLTSDGQFGVWGDYNNGAVWFFSKDSSTPLWMRPMDHPHSVQVVALAYCAGAIRDVAVTNVTTLKTVVGQGYCINITVTVENQGTLTETFGVATPYLDGVVIPTSEQWKTFWSNGDVNLDGYIDQTDYDIITENLGWQGAPGENPADINSDGIVDWIDQYRCGAHPGRDIWTQFGLPVPPKGAQRGVKLHLFDQATLTFTVNTTSFAKGNYTISAYAEPVQGETHTADNNFTDGWVVVSMVGDLTGGGHSVWDFVPDGSVDGSDLIVTAMCFGSYPGVPPPLKWNANCDITNDGSIDGSDLIIIARHFGETSP